MEEVGGVVDVVGSRIRLWEEIGGGRRGDRGGGGHGEEVGRGVDDVAGLCGVFGEL